MSLDRLNALLLISEKSADRDLEGLPLTGNLHLATLLALDLGLVEELKELDDDTLRQRLQLGLEGLALRLRELLTEQSDLAPRLTLGFGNLGALWALLQQSLDLRGLLLANLPQAELLAGKLALRL